MNHVVLLEKPDLAVGGVLGDLLQEQEPVLEPGGEEVRDLLVDRAEIERGREDVRPEVEQELEPARGVEKPSERPHSRRFELAAQLREERRPADGIAGARFQHRVERPLERLSRDLHAGQEEREEGLAGSARGLPIGQPERVEELERRIARPLDLLQEPNEPVGRRQDFVLGARGRGRGLRGSFSSRIAVR